MLNTIFNQKILNLLIAIIIAIFTTGYLRVHFITFFPEPDGGFYTYFAQEIHAALSNGQNISSDMPLSLYPLITSWVFSFEINQYIALRWIDLLLAVVASILFYKIILKESGSTIFTIILAGSALLVMNNKDIILYGFRNSIWVSYLPLFGALLIWQSISKADGYKFYLIGGLVALGILLREPFLLFIVLGGVSIFIGYGWNSFFKYLVGSALVGVITLGSVLFFREGNLLDLINTYFILTSEVNMIELSFIDVGLLIVDAFWFLVVISMLSIFYAIKSYRHNKNLININRFFFWAALALITLLEPLLKMPAPYHFANFIPGLVGLSAVGWSSLSLNQSDKTKKYSILIIILISIYGIYPNLSASLNSKHFKDSKASAHYAYNALWTDIYSSQEQIKWSAYLLIADVIKRSSNKESTLAVMIHSLALYPITGLRPPVFKLYALDRLYWTKLDRDESKFIDILKKYQPTIITTIMYKFPAGPEPQGLKETIVAIEKTNLYEKISTVTAPNVLMGEVYRLKDFK